MNLHPLPSSYVAARAELQRLATHVLARRRFDVCGKFGLRATPGGIGTPAFGPDHETIRISSTRLLRETSGATPATTSLDLVGANLGDAAALVGVDLDRPFSAGHDTPAAGDVRSPLEVDAESARVLFEWFGFGWGVLDAALGALGADAAPSVVQLWPEHFDAGCDVLVGRGRRANLGVSPGDSSSAQPYLYVGPWGDERPGDPKYWNTPFGAVMTYGELGASGSADPVSTAVAFLLRGVGLLAELGDAPEGA